jgi:hypothetical protein
MCCETRTAQSNMCSTYIRKAQSNQNERKIPNHRETLDLYLHHPIYSMTDLCTVKVLIK